MFQPYLINDPLTGRYFRDPAPREVHGDWVPRKADATEYRTRAAAEAVARRVGGRGWQHRLQIIRPAQIRQLVIPQYAREYMR